MDKMKKQMVGTCLGVLGIFLWFMPFVYVQFSNMVGYQNGVHIGGLAYLLIVACAAYAALSWLQIHPLRMLASGISSLICIYFLLLAGASVAWGLILLTVVSVVSFVLGFKDFKAEKV